MNPPWTINYDKSWHHVALAIAFIFAFIFGGASREALDAHMLYNAYGWFAVTAILLLKNKIIFESVPRILIVLFLSLFLWTCVTLVPLPAEWFEGYLIHENRLTERRLFDLETNWLTLSTAPDHTVRSILAFGPGVFSILCVSLMSDKHRQRLLYGILLLGVLSISLGLAQIFMGKYSPLYIWETTNRGFAVGIFANTNHQSSFSALLIPLLLTQAFHYKYMLGKMNDNLVPTLFFLGMLALIIIGVITGSSLAGYILAVLAFILSIVFLKSSGPYSTERKNKIIIGGLSFIFGIAALVYTSPRLYNLGVTNLDGTSLSRIDTYRRSLHILRDNFYMGTGFGSFPKVFPFYEDAQTVTRTFMNHAHNDWLELAIELGLPGLMLLLLFTIWVTTRYIVLFFGTEIYLGKSLSKAAAISVCILTLHSFVDYPLRTPFLGLLFATLLALSLTRSYEPDLTHKN
ncbi:MAG: O-antigen ligase family protein [Maricaulaceae bacterium]